MTYGSCHRMWLSKVHTYVNPYVSAFLARSTTRADGGVVCSTTPRSMSSYRFVGKPRSTDDVRGSGQRDVTTLLRVKKLMPSGPYMCWSPNRLAFQPPKL